jgi:hypothetical protein
MREWRLGDVAEFLGEHHAVRARDVSERVSR